MSVIRGLGRIPAQLQQQHIRTLEASFIAASSRFGSYNFREYFSRKVRHKFDVQLPTLIGTSQIDDQILERASIMNRLFEAPKLVVEGAANIRSSSVSDQDESDRLKTQELFPTTTLPTPRQKFDLTFIRIFLKLSARAIQKQ
ncbi:hypothetical protein PSHT_00946 [Puccinia striiformis]|uniref:Uncharacterized protein n=1 Tax=Puccinia striiformis TaxID=27350 RepID=A0A2S4WLY1_9BASI|nr:hypothetical protein PSHT_00946 [Puccinia striiformis]